MDALTRDPETGSEQIAAPRSRARRAMIALLCLLMAAGIVYVVWFWPKHETTDAARPRSAPVPVVVADANRRDVPIYLEGLGTVQAFNTVTIKAMVDGPLTAVNFQEGQEVKPGDVLATIDSRSYKAALDQAIAKKQQDEATLANARLDLARYQKLVASNYTSGQTADTARAQVAQDEAQVAQDQAQIDNARTQLSYTTITSPIEGLAGIRQVDAGNIVHASDTTGLVVIAQLQPISVVFTLPQQALPAVARAMAAGTPEVQAVAQAGAQAGTRAGASVLDRGTLAVLDNEVDPTTGTIKLKATFPNANRQLWPGGFVTVRLLVDMMKDATVVPTAAVQRGPNGSYIYVLGDQGTVSRRAVTVGHENLSGSVISAGVEPGAKVVVEGASRLTDGAQVTVVPAAASSRSALPGTEPATAPGATRQAGHSAG